LPERGSRRAERRNCRGRHRPDRRLWKRRQLRCVADAARVPDRAIEAVHIPRSRRNPAHAGVLSQGSHGGSRCKKPRERGSRHDAAASRPEEKPSNTSVCHRRSVRCACGRSKCGRCNRKHEEPAKFRHFRENAWRLRLRVPERAVCFRSRGIRAAPTRRFIEAFQSDSTCPVPRAKIFLFRFFRNQRLSVSSRLHTRGVSRSSRT
jgi:hypothetical protein